MANIFPNHTENDEEKSVDKMLKSVKAPYVNPYQQQQSGQEEADDETVDTAKLLKEQTTPRTEQAKADQNTNSYFRNTDATGSENGNQAAARALRNEELSEKYGWTPTVTPQQQAYIDTVVEQSMDPLADSAKLHSAIAMSQWLDIPVDYAYQNLDTLYDQNIGGKYKPNLTAWQSIINSATVGKLTVDFQDGAYQWKRLVMAGREEEAAELEKTLSEKQEYMESLSDYVPRNLVTKGLQFTAGTLPYTLELGARSAVTGLPAGLAGATAASYLAGGGLTAGAGGLAIGASALGTGGISLAAILAASMAVGTFMESKKLFEGDMFWTLMHQNIQSPDGKEIKVQIDPKVAARIAEIDGAINGMVEAGLSFVSAGGKALTRSLLGEAASKTMARMMAHGVTSRFVLAAAEMVKEGASEGLQEMTEEFIDTAARSMAYELSDYANPEELVPTLIRGGKAFGEAFVSTLIMGLPGGAVSTNVSVQNAKRLKAFMEVTPSKETAVNSEFVQSIKPDEVSKTDWNQAMSDMWERSNATINTEASPKGDTFHRTANGRLFTRDEEVTSKDSTGTETRRFLIGDPEAQQGVRGKQYGAIEYELSDNGSKLTITSVKMEKMDSELIKEAVTDLVSDNPNASIDWETNGNQTLEAIKEEIIKSNPLGESQGLQFASQEGGEERMRVTQAISRGFGKALDNKQMQVATDLLYAMADGKGMGATQYLSRYFTPEAFRTLESLKGEDLDNLLGKRKVSQSMLGFIKGIQQLTQAGKSIIYAGEHADFSTFAHETFHALEAVTDQRDSLMDAIKVSDSDGSLQKYVASHRQLFPSDAFGDNPYEVISQAVKAWQAGQVPTSMQSEVMARLFEGYLYDGKTFSDKLRLMFAKIADWMRRIYRTMVNSGVTLSDDIIKQFDTLLSKKESGFSQNQEQEQQETTENTSDDAQQGRQQKAGAIPGTNLQTEQEDITKTQEYQETEKRLIAEGAFDSKGRGLVNGKVSNYFKEANWLTSAQKRQVYITVRTPSFLAWFGDWMNDPEHASRVVDENGEPKLLSFLPFSTSEYVSPLDTMNMPVKFRNIINSWDYISRSPYSASYYNMAGKTWDNTPEGIIRISDHWNFYSQGKKHIITDVPVENNTHWTMAQYHDGIWHVLETLPNEPDTFNAAWEGKEQLDGMEMTHKDMGEVTIRNWSGSGRHFRLVGEETYRGEVVKKTDSFLTIKTDDGNVYRSQTYTLLPTAIRYREKFFFTDQRGQVKSALHNTGEFNESERNILFQTVYHGSPHSFDKFSLDHVGSGEGQQAFGYGLYFTGSEEIAQWYAEMYGRTEEVKRGEIEHYRAILEERSRKTAEAKKRMESKDAIEKEKQEIRDDYSRIRSGEERAPVFFGKVHPERTLDEWEQLSLDGVEDSLKRAYETALSYQQAAEQYLKKAEAMVAEGKNLYTVDIPDRKYLKWDKPVPTGLAEKMFKRLGLDEDDRSDFMNYHSDSGRTLYDFLTNQFGNDENKVREFLLSVGVAGVEYPAGEVAGKSKGKVHNFVLFDADKAKILDHILLQTVSDDQKKDVGLALGVDDAERKYGIPKDQEVGQEAVAASDDDKDMSAGSDFLKSLKRVEDIPPYRDDSFIIDEKEDLVDSEEAYQAYIDRYVKPQIQKNQEAQKAEAGTKGQQEDQFLSEVDELSTIQDYAKKTYRKIAVSGTEAEKDAQFAEALKDENTLRRILSVLGNVLMLNSTSLNAEWVEKVVSGYGRKRLGSEKQINPFIDESARQALQSRLERIIDNQDIIKAINYTLRNKPFPRTTGLLSRVQSEITQNSRFYRNVVSWMVGDKNLRPGDLGIGSTTMTREDMDNASIATLRTMRADALVDATIKQIDDTAASSPTESAVMENVVRRLKERLDEATTQIEELRKGQEESEEKDKRIRDRDMQINSIISSLESISGKLKAKNADALSESSPIVKRYGEITSALYAINDEKNYQELATDKGSREKGKARGEKMGSRRWLDDMVTMYPQLKPIGNLGSVAKEKQLRQNIETWRQELMKERNDIRVDLAHRLASSLDRNSTKLLEKVGSDLSDSLAKRVMEAKRGLDQLKKAKDHVRRTLIDSMTSDERLSMIAKESETYESFREAVEDEFVQGKERIPRTDKETFLRTTWIASTALPDDEYMYGDQALTKAAKESESFDEFKEWVEQNDAQILESIDEGNDMTLEHWLRSLYTEANRSDPRQDLAGASYIEAQEQARLQDDKRDKKFIALINTDEGLAGFLAAVKDPSLLAEDVRITVADATDEEISAAREVILRDPRYYRWVYADQSGKRSWIVNDLGGQLPEIDDREGRMRYSMSDVVRKRRDRARKIKNEELRNAVLSGDEKYVDGVADKIIKDTDTELSKLAEKLKQIKKQAKADQEKAVRETKEQIAVKQKTKREARDTKAYMQNLADYITSKIPSTVDIRVAQVINRLVAQSGIDPHFRNGKAKFQGKMMNLDEIRKILTDNGWDANSAEVSATLFDKLTKKPLGQWTVADLEALAQQVSYLREWGRAVLQERQMRFRTLVSGIQSGLREEIRTSGRKPNDELPITAEEKSKARRSRSTMGAFLSTINPEHFARILDNGKNGSFFDVLVRKKRNAQDVEWNGINSRLESVDKQFGELGYKMEDMNRKVEFEKGHTIAVGELMYAVLVQRNERSHDAYVYGKLVDTETKRRILQESRTIEGTTGEQFVWANQQVRKVGDLAYQQILAIADDGLTDKDQKAMEIIYTDMNSQLGRINAVANDVYNMEVTAEEGYIPIQRMGDRTGQDDNGHQIMANMFARGAVIDQATGVFKGFTKDRVTISPIYQKPVNSDLFTVWSRSLTAQEHFISFSELNKVWNSTFRSGSLSALDTDIDMYYGKAYTDYLAKYMNDVISPAPVIDSSSKLVQLLRGNLPAAYLAFKASSVVLQAITSPAAFLMEVNPAELTISLMRVGTHYQQSIDFVNQRSTFMKNRTMNPYVEIQRILREDPTLSRFAHNLSRFQESGMAGMEVADRVSVYAGWIASFNKRMKELGGIETDENVLQASRYADEVVHKTQPVSDDTELAPLFKGSTFKRAFTQFGVAMNVIYNNITVDAWALGKQIGDKTAPKEARVHAFRQLAGMISGYMLAGVALGMVRQGFKDDDDDKDKARKVLYYSLSQFIGSVPLVSDLVDMILQKWITGEKGPQYTQTLYPGLYSIAQGVTAKTPETAWKNIARGVGIMFGLPVSAEKQIQESLEKRSVWPLLGRSE